MKTRKNYKKKRRYLGGSLTRRRSARLLLPEKARLLLPPPEKAREKARERVRRLLPVNTILPVARSPSNWQSNWQTINQSPEKPLLFGIAKPVTRSQTKVAQEKHKVEAAKKIVKFLKHTKHTRKANYLKTIYKSLCSDAGVCLAFGLLADAIKEHFSGFTSFNYVKAPIRRIGNPSANGFISQIDYDHRDYKASAILKSSKTMDADNLLYEYVVGQYINKLNKYYPCFLETYGYYMYNDLNYWQEMQDNPLIDDVQLLRDGLSLQHSIDYNDACRESKQLAILIQYFKGIESLEKMTLNLHFIENELMWTLFQLYIPLAKLKNNFTHYDLHLENIYLYSPVADKYIEFHYAISSTRTISFKSSYIAKIIDYGRSYFKDDVSGINSKLIYDNELCGAAADCNDEEFSGTCGEDVGFGWLRPNKSNPADNYYISSQKKNISHDLLPLSRIYQAHSFPKPNLLTTDLYDLVKKVIYTTEFGTAEIVDTGYPHNIFNVQDAAKFIMGYVSSTKYINKNNQVNASKEKLGDLYVYANETPMKFVPYIGDSPKR
jgi:hypothetical protein